MVLQIAIISFSLIFATKWWVFLGASFLLLSRFAYVFNFSMPSRSFSKMSCNFSGQNVLEFWKIRFLITTLDYHWGRLYQYETTLIFYGNIDLSSSSRQKRAFINGTCITHGERKCRKMCLTQSFFFQIHHPFWTARLWRWLEFRGGAPSLALDLEFPERKSCDFPVHPLQWEYVNW